MKILMVSMNSIHFQRWTNQLEDSGHEVFWFDIRDGNGSSKLPWVKQIVRWKQKFSNLKGRNFVKKQFPWLYKKLSFLIENNTEKVFEKWLLEIQPDVVHSFVLYVSCVPIFRVMKRHAHVKWIYSSWGSDLYYFQNKPTYLKGIKMVLPRINYLFTDCKRDVELAKKYGFNGEVLGTFPGGGGYPNKEFDNFILPVEERKIILVKGYQGRSGRAIPVLKAIKNLSKKLKACQIVVFGADNEVLEHIKNSHLKSLLNLKVYGKSEFLSHTEILKLMGKSLIYIGNSNSDGMPNTLLEAIIMGAFPIQSNPGDATSEIVENYKNGLLINDCENSREIENLIMQSLANMQLIKAAFEINQTEIKPKLSRETIAEQVVSKYNSILS